MIIKEEDIRRSYRNRNINLDVDDKNLDIINKNFGVISSNSKK